MNRQIRILLIDVDPVLSAVMNHYNNNNNTNIIRTSGTNSNSETGDDSDSSDTITFIYPSPGLQPTTTTPTSTTLIDTNNNDSSSCSSSSSSSSSSDTDEDSESTIIYTLPDYSSHNENNVNASPEPAVQVANDSVPTTEADQDIPVDTYNDSNSIDIYNLTITDIYHTVLPNTQNNSNNSNNKPDELWMIYTVIIIEEEDSR